jgi:hypothetical protein
VPELLATWEETFMGRFLTSRESLPSVDFSTVPGRLEFLGWFDATAGSLLMVNSMFYRAALDGL